MLAVGWVNMSMHDDGTVLLAFILGTLGAGFVFFSVSCLAAQRHEIEAADRACKDRGGYVVRTSADVVCKDRTQWHWREGYVVRMREAK